ncbi:MAG: penicillin-binding protein activator LpoB, partial [Bacteroidaceae bacterium]|nr:penicillin-binding protein activator LpoB [Bacteroidaceae bacterium]
MKKTTVLAIAALAFAVSASAQRKVEVVETAPTAQQPAGKILKRKVAIGRFSNETQYAKGLFYDKENDPMAKQALDILSAKLAASNQFILLERNDLASLLEECKKGEGAANTIGADYMIIG